MPEILPAQFATPLRTTEQLRVLFRIQEAFRQPKHWTPAPGPHDQEDLPIED